MNEEVRRLALKVNELLDQAQTMEAMLRLIIKIIRNLPVGSISAADKNEASRLIEAIKEMKRVKL